jgi:hypothetical protein
MFFFVGFLLGLIRETCVIFYYRAIQRRSAWLGSVLTLAIGLIDLLVLARLAWDKDVWMVAGYLLGETIGTNLSIRAGR